MNADQHFLSDPRSSAFIRGLISFRVDPDLHPLQNLQIFFS